MDQADRPADVGKTRPTNADTPRKRSSMPRTFSDDDRAYDLGYKAAQYDLFWFIVVLGVGCVIGGVVVGLCI